MFSRYYLFRSKAVVLRKDGKTYGEIKKILGKPIPKSTLSHWFTGINLTKAQQNRISTRVINSIRKAQAKAWLVNRARRESYIRSIRDRVRHLSNELYKKNNAKIALAMLYLGEGSKSQRGSLSFGNSDPFVIRLFLKLLRCYYQVNESKFRCTLQCRADQNIKKLEKFWSDITLIPLSRFYRARIDPRTIGRKSKKPDYKGVCRIDYFSSEIRIELQQIIEVINEGL